MSPVQCRAPQLTALLSGPRSVRLSGFLCAAVRVRWDWWDRAALRSGSEKRRVRTGNDPPGAAPRPAPGAVCPGPGPLGFGTQSLSLNQSATQPGSEGGSEILTVHTWIFGLLVKMGRLHVKRGNKEGRWDLKTIDERSDLVLVIKPFNSAGVSPQLAESGRQFKISSLRRVFK